ncbi:helix-turn-helix domain-containing protein [Anaerotruncus massiliensis (ex Liu et al. 2021)]|uniref:helix-turn-helix domain-containing protein n=1 Tax=Anaerotruncus TaxID=244127 RepID=UPI003F5A30A4
MRVRTQRLFQQAGRGRCEQGSTVLQPRSLYRTWLDDCRPQEKKGMSQEEFAARAKISRSHLSSIEAPNIVRLFSLGVVQYCGCFRSEGWRLAESFHFASS